MQWACVGAGRQKRSMLSGEKTGKVMETNLYSSNVDPSRIPSSPFPAFHAHGSEAQETNRAVTLAHLYPIPDLALTNTSVKR